MCGIAGIWGHAAPDRLATVAAALNHRGPDDETFAHFAGGALGFAHRRLSIIDLVTGRQPMTNEDGSVAVMFNGEVYNYRELRQELAARGHVLRTNSDTETVVHLYEEFGAAAAAKLRGMFAIAIWDDREQQLVLIRDRAGKKPLYYCEADEEFLFASEINALRAALREPPAVDPPAIHEFLTWGMISAPRTIYQSIHSLEPGHGAVIRDRRIIRNAPYWRFRMQPKTNIRRDEAIGIVDEKLREAVHLRLRSDVPVGVFLSGGLDSGIVTAMAAQAQADRLTTITIGFEEAAFDERVLARQVAERYHTNHHEVILRPDVAADLPNILAAYGQPFGDSSAVPSWYVARAARQFVKVVLNGDGGDELFAGYRRYVAGRIVQSLGPLASATCRPIWSTLSEILPAPRGFRTGYAFAHRLIRGLSLPPDRRAAAWTVDGFDSASLASLGWKAELVAGNTETSIADDVDHFIRTALSAFDDCGEVDRMLGFDFVTVLPNDLLVKMDIATMSHSLEARSPMLDQELIDSVAVFPQSLKLDGFTTKPLLRELGARYLPRDVCTAPKRGFEAPVAGWLENELRPLAADVILAPNGLLNELFHRGHLESLLRNDGGLDPARWSRRVWLLLSLGLWHAAARNSSAHRRSAAPIRSPAATVLPT